MPDETLDLARRIEANKLQLGRIKVDENLVHSHWASERAVVAFIPPTARTILDLGCGPTGGMLMHVPDMVYVGSDFVHEYLTDLQRRHSTKGPWEFAIHTWVTSSMEALPFPDGHFDVVYSRHALEHSSDLRSTLSEIKRVLKSGGLFIFCVPSRRDDTELTHLTRWSGWQWRRAFGTVGRVRLAAHHDYFIDELYGYAEKPGAVRPVLLHRLRRWVDFSYGQGLLPTWLVRRLVWIYARLRTFAAARAARAGRIGRK